MTYKEFKKKYNGKYVDYDGACGYQCWDLGQKYFTECLKLPASVLGGCGLVSNMLYAPKRAVLNKYFTETKSPKAGDIAIWEYGHIAIYDSKNKYFSQNPNPCKVITIKKGGVHFFKLKTTPSPTPTTKYYKKCDKKYTSLVDALNSIGVNSSFSNRKVIAKKNGIQLYIGSAKQNTKLLNLLKQGKLKK